MGSRDEPLLRGRTYGHAADDPHPGRTYAELGGGPLDGQLFDFQTELGQFGPCGRVLYDPRPGPLELEW